MLLTLAGALETFSVASPQAEAITDLFWISIWVLTGIVVVVFGGVGYSVLKFRGKDGDPDPAPVHGNTRLEITWTAIPFLIVAFLFYLNMEVMKVSNPEPAAGDEPGIVVVGHQWWWEVRYPGAGAVTANEVHVPVGRKTLVRLESADVIHDFWVPELGPKMDVVPGHQNHLWLEPRQAGVYLGACAEFCGNSHAWMRFEVVAQDPAEYEAWLQAVASPAPPPSSLQAAEGGRIFQEMACLNCHQESGQVGSPNHGPDLNGLALRRTLGAGVLPNSPENLAKWLRDPQEYKPGCNMPDFNLTEDQVQALVAYLWRTSR